MEYIRVSKGLSDYNLYRKDQPIDDIITNPNADYYESLYRYQEKHYQHYLKTNSVAGIKDVVTERLVFDFDDETNVDNARNDALDLCTRLIQNHGLNRDDFRIFFSGNKGFHIELMTTSEFNRKEFEHIVWNLADGLETLDKRITDEQRIIRVPLTKHPKTKLYKIPLTVDELSECPVETIFEMAKNDAEEFYELFNTWKKVNLPDSILKLGNLTIEEKQDLEENIVYDERLELSRKPSWMSSTKFALQEGFFHKGDGKDEGERNNAFMILAATYKANGYPKEIAWRMLKGVAELQAKRHNCEQYSEQKLWNNIIKAVYTDNWLGGTYSENETELLQKIAQRFNLKDSEETDRKLVSISESLDRFKEYAREFSKNRIKTGIKLLDDNLTLVTGMAVGLLGAPGCHAKGTKILMFDGTVINVENIRVGDLLMGPDSQPREVLKLCQGREKMVKFKPYRSEEFIVNMGHILNLSPSKLKVKGRLPGNLNIKVSDYIKGLEKKNALLSGYKLHKTEVSFSQSKELQLDPYILGIWLGDGTASKTQITTIDNEILMTLENYFLDKNVEITQHGSNQIEYNIVNKTRKPNSNFFLNQLRGYELLNNKHIPQVYKTSSREERLQLLAGLIDSDGYLEANKKGWGITQKSDKLANDILFLARSLGFHASLNKREKYCVYNGEKKYGIYNHIYISGNESIFDVPVKLERKKPISSVKTTNHQHYGFSYEILEEDNYYGFVIDRDHLYLTEDFMVHHNSGKTSFANNFLKYTSMNEENCLYECLDMTENFLVARMLQNYCSHSFQDILSMIEDDEVTDELNEAFVRVAEDYSRISINYRSGTNIEDIENDIKTHIAGSGKPPRLVVVDYLEKIRGPYTDPTANSGYIASRLADLAREYNTCILILLQPQKSAGDARAALLSMRRVKGASVIEQDLRAIMTMWRPGFNPEKKENDKYANVAIVKNNMGETCKLDFMWDGLSGQIREMTSAEKEIYEQFLDDLKQEEEEESQRNDPFRAKTKS